MYYFYLLFRILSFLTRTRTLSNVELVIITSTPATVIILVPIPAFALRAW